MNFTILVKNIIYFFILVFISQPIYSQDENIDDLIKKQYKIEVIFFTYNEFDPDEESFDNPEPNTLLDLINKDILTNESKRSKYTVDRIISNLNTVNFSDSYQLRSPINSLETNNIYWFKLLDNQNYTLNGIADRLNTLDVYTTVSHGAWVQEAYSENEPYIFKLHHLGSMNPLGTIHFYESRFLHVRIDAEYSSKYLDVSYSDLINKIKIPHKYNINNDKIIRVGEINYFDHPAFGMIILVEDYP
jgi:hypothetical protein|tara:strand:+ start:35186 stop:35923 length:738 start_codon:yes stop_codon:yes gene_type:complete